MNDNIHYKHLKTILTENISPSGFIMFNFYYVCVLKGWLFLNLGVIFLLAKINDTTILDNITIAIYSLILFIFITTISVYINIGKKDDLRSMNLFFYKHLTFNIKYNFKDCSYIIFINYLENKIDKIDKITLLDQFLEQDDKRLNMAFEEFLSNLNKFENFTYSDFKYLVRVLNRHKDKYDSKYGYYDFPKMIETTESMIAEKFSTKISSF
jgi:hypothetical protein